MFLLPAIAVVGRQCTFSETGIDYILHDFAKGPHALRRHLRLKTCLQARAFYLELPYTMSMEVVLPALPRFDTRNGMPINMHSANGASFVGA